MDSREAIPKNLIVDTLVAQNYTDYLSTDNVVSPPAGSSRFHALSTGGFTRFIQENESTTDLTLGRDTVLIVFNNTGATLPKISAVYISDAVGNIPSVTLAKASDLNKKPVIGVVLDDIPDGSFGEIMNFGIIDNVNAGAFSVGDVLYLDPSVAGGLTTTRPGYPYYTQRIGSVISNDLSIGSYFISIGPYIGEQESGTHATIWTGSEIDINTATYAASVFSGLGTPTNGTIKYCSDCKTTTPATCTANLPASCVCASGGVGAFAKRVNGSWYCN